MHVCIYVSVCLHLYIYVSISLHHYMHTYVPASLCMYEFACLHLYVMCIHISAYLQHYMNVCA